MQLEEEKDSVLGERAKENQAPPQFHYNVNCLLDIFNLY